VTWWWWRHFRHEHQPVHPGRWELWYCRRCRRAMCYQGRRSAGDPDYWTPYVPGKFWPRPLRGAHGPGTCWPDTAHPE
jgi:hypothetical protein